MSLSEFLNYRIVNGEKEILPWMSVSTVEFLEQVLTKEMEVFEFGCGGSTVYIYKRVKSMISIEHDSRWKDFIQRQCDENNNLIINLVDGEDFPDAILAYDKLFDLVIIDGENREKCLFNAWDKIKIGGILLFHDSDRPEFVDVIKKEISNRVGWEFMHFGGPIQLGNYKNDAAVFAKKVQ